MSFYSPASNFSIILSPNNLSTVLNDFIKISAIENVTKYIFTYEYCPWLFSLLGSICVGLCGIFPLLIIPIDDAGDSLKAGDNAKKLRVLLSFAVGGLLGDVFLHLLPEAWETRVKQSDTGHPSISCGLWVLSGMLAFIILEKIFSNVESEVTSNSATTATCHNSDIQIKTDSVNNNDPKSKKIIEVHAISGYLNLAANSIDNFTHGLAIGTSFCMSFKLGVFSTFAILVHELPHEVGDFAILLKSGFTRWEAAKAQVMTAMAGICGSMVAVMFGASNASASWILPFTSGGFLHIALVSVLPELIREESCWESAKQITSLVSGIAIMAAMIFFFD